MDDEPVPGIAGALDDIRAFAAGMCEEAGDPGALERLRLDRTDTRLVFQVIDAEACGSSISGFLKPGRAHIMVRNALNRILRQRSRERAIVEAGETPGADPAWSIDIHPVTLSVLIHGGVNPALTALLERLAGPDDALKRAAQGGPLRIGDAKLVSGRVSIATISGNGHPTDDVVNVHENTQYLQTVMIRQGLPDTVVAGLPGRLLGDVTDHPMLARALGVRIMAAQCNGDVLTLDMEDERVTLATPPDGAPWLRFPWFTPAD
jgi:hypothetical protein